MIDPTSLVPGFYWIRLGQNPPEVAFSHLYTDPYEIEEVIR